MFSIIQILYHKIVCLSQRYEVPWSEVTVLMYLLLVKLCLALQELSISGHCGPFCPEHLKLFLIFTLNQSPMNLEGNFPLVSDDNFLQTGYNGQTHFAGLLVAGTEK